MPFEFFQIPVSGRPDAVSALNRRLQSGRIASVRKEFVANGEESFWAFCVEYLDEFRSAAIGLEPCEPWRRLEQQREQRPRGQSQQEQAVQPQQQQRVPLGPQLRPGSPDGAIRRSHQGTEPAAVPTSVIRGEITNASLRASRAVDAASKARSGGPFFE